MEPQFDIQVIQQVLRNVTGKDGNFTQRSLSKAAGEGRDCVGDIINGRNKNPTIKVLTNLAAALSQDLSIFGVTQPKSGFFNVADLERAIADHLPMALKVRGEKRARFLAEAVAESLGLLEVQKAIQPTVHLFPSGDAVEVGPPLSPTT